MKTRTYVVLLTMIVAITLLIACGNKKEEMYGTWINEDYKGNTPPFEKFIITSDGKMEFFKTEVAPWEPEIELSDGEWMPCDFHIFTIDDKWSDSDGNIWYKVAARVGGYEKIATNAYLLMKVSDSNNVLEYMVGRLGYHEELDSSAVKYTYRIYYLQE